MPCKTNPQTPAIAENRQWQLLYLAEEFYLISKKMPRKIRGICLKGWLTVPHQYTTSLLDQSPCKGITIRHPFIGLDARNDRQH
jgi:hypothetical protein